MRFQPRCVAAVLAGALAGLGGTAAKAVAEGPPSAVEEFDYPGASRIFAERGILLKKGSGSLLLTDCVVGADLIEIRSRNRDPFCFKAVADTGWLTVELAETYLIFSDSRHTTEAIYTISGASAATRVAPGDAAGIGEGTGQPGPSSATLSELRVS